MSYQRICVVVLDSVGIGALPDAGSFGDEGSHTLGHIVERVPHIQLPILASWGLGNIEPLSAIAPSTQPDAFYGKMAEVSIGKDTMTGHWELMGLKVDNPLNVYPQGFPESLLQQFEQATGRKTIGNIAASGTAIIEQFGAEHMKTGAWIVYTSADSVFQIAAHEDIIPLAELYRACEIARELTLQPPYIVGRIIARPFIGEPGCFQRTSNRHDYALAPPAPTVMNHLSKEGYDVLAVGKINDIFCGSGITEAFPTQNNLHGIQLSIDLLQCSFKGLLFTNLVDFDSLYGHRRDVEGYAACLEQFEQSLSRLTKHIGDDDLLIVTADHGNDPTHAGTDHTREYVPILIYNPKFHAKGRSIGTRTTFADLAATIADNFGVAAPHHGMSFLALLEDQHVPITT
jgi:phosphopentomutase